MSSTRSSSKIKMSIKRENGKESYREEKKKKKRRETPHLSNASIPFLIHLVALLIPGIFNDF